MFPTTFMQRNSIKEYLMMLMISRLEAAKRNAYIGAISVVISCVPMLMSAAIHIATITYKIR